MKYKEFYLSLKIILIWKTDTENQDAKKNIGGEVETNIVQELISEEKKFEKVLEAFKKELQDQINSINVKNEKSEKIKILEGKIDKLTMDQIDLKYRIDVLEKQKSMEKFEKNVENLVKEETGQNQIEFFNIPTLLWFVIVALILMVYLSCRRKQTRTKKQFWYTKIKDMELNKKLDQIKILIRYLTVLTRQKWICIYIGNY